MCKKTRDLFESAIGLRSKENKGEAEKIVDGRTLYWNDEKGTERHWRKSWKAEEDGEKDARSSDNCIHLVYTFTVVSLGHIT